MEEKNEIIKKDPSYGKIICRCEQVTEGEILRAIRENPPAKDIDGVKRRTRSGMGRCQGGFCQPFVAELLAKEKGIDVPFNETITNFLKDVEDGKESIFMENLQNPCFTNLKIKLETKNAITFNPTELSI